MAHSETDDGGEIYWPSAIGGETPPELATGNDEDDQILRQIAARTSLDVPRSWQHFLLVPDEDAAEAAARPLLATDWEVSIAPPDDEDEDSSWCVMAERDNVVLTARLVRSTREMFEQMASYLPGASYDGWQASIDFDEFFEAMTGTSGPADVTED
jgi:Regulator of ribonuclease activity B